MWYPGCSPTDEATASALQVIQMHVASPHLLHETFMEANYINPTALMTNTRIVSVTVPQGQLGILDGMALSVSDLVDYDALVFQLRVNGAAVPGFDDIRGPIGDVIDPHPLAIPLMSGVVVDIVVRNTLDQAFTFTTGALVGRFFPQALDIELRRLAAAGG